MYAWVNEICHEDVEERAIVIGVAQTLGQAFIAWVPGTLPSLSTTAHFLLTILLVVILNVGKYAPKFKMGFTVMSVLSVGEFSMIFVIRYFVNRDKRKVVAAERLETPTSSRESEIQKAVNDEKGFAKESGSAIR